MENDMKDFFDWVYPYDKATCGNCLAMHCHPFSCLDLNHAELHRVASELKLAADLMPRETFVNVRELFAHLYPNNAAAAHTLESVAHDNEEVRA